MSPTTDVADCRHPATPVADRMVAIAVDAALCEIDRQTAGALDRQLMREARGAGLGAASGLRGAVLTLADVERLYILDTLASCGGCVSAAARVLGIYRSSLQRRLKRYRRAAAASSTAAR